MPTRTIKLKIVLPRSEGGRPLRCDLWTTHAVVNQAVRQIEDVLLLCRGDSYVDAEGGVHCRDEVRSKAIGYARAIQRENGHSDEGDDEQIFVLLEHLYKGVVESAEKPGSGQAQHARGFVSPLMDASSQGGRYAARKLLNRLPPWVEMMQTAEAGWEARSQEWLSSDEARDILKATGAPPRWVRLQRTGKPWQEAFLADQKRLRLQVANDPLEPMRALGLLPLLEPPVRARLVGARGRVSPWDHLAVRLAVGHLNSWESNDHRTRKEYAALRSKVEQLRGRVDQKALQHVRDYEQSRHEELKRVALATDASPYRVGRRSLRGWEITREQWQSAGCQSSADRINVLARMQARLRGRFGDHDFYLWLAQEAQEPLWRDTNPLPEIVLLNDSTRRLARKKETAAFTTADPRLHPRWVLYEPNLRNYRIEQDGQALHMRLPLLHDAGNSALGEVEHRIRLAPSDQFGQVKLALSAGLKASPKVTYITAGQMHYARVKGADLLFDRRKLENRSLTRLAEGQIRPVWLKLALDVAPQIPEDWLAERGKVKKEASVEHFMHAANTKRPQSAPIGPGLRVLSVDLGVRTFAACSVFALRDHEPKTGLHFRAQGVDDFWAAHERSFLLTLPGERPGEEVIHCRDTAREELRDLRFGLSRLRALLKLSVRVDATARRAILSQWLEEGAWPKCANSGTDGTGGLKRLFSMVDAKATVWERAVLEWRAQLDAEIGEQLSQWRRCTRPRAADGADYGHRRGYAGGKSMWAIQYLTDVRRLLLSWSLHGRRAGDIRRQDRERGVFASHLLTHINHLKEDRVKTGADLIVQAARGMVRDADGRWNHRYDPCRVILVENLARYLFKMDRPRSENSRLMQWAHREIYKAVKMQAEEYGIRVIDVAAGFSSRYHASSGAPGLRVRRITEKELEDPAFQSRLLTMTENAPWIANQLQLGMLVPWEGGPEFATLGPDGQSLVTIHSDINAAQNLQRRSWTRYTDAYRIRATKFEEDNRELWLPNSIGSRLQGALMHLGLPTGHARLLPAQNGDGYVLDAIRKAYWQRTMGAEKGRDDDEIVEEEATDDVEILEELKEAVRTRIVETFFRDPSGSVLPADRWYPAKVFWGRVHARIAALLRAPNEDPF